MNGDKEWTSTIFCEKVAVKNNNFIKKLVYIRFSRKPAIPVPVVVHYVCSNPDLYTVPQLIYFYITKNKTKQTTNDIHITTTYNMAWWLGLG